MVVQVRLDDLKAHLLARPILPEHIIEVVLHALVLYMPGVPQIRRVYDI